MANPILANSRQVVAYELGNRADITTLGTSGAPSRVDIWLWKSYLNLGMSYGFEQSEFTADGQWSQGMDSIQYPDDCRAIKSIMFYSQNGLVINPQWKDMNYLRRYPFLQSGGLQQTPSVGPPAIIAPFGTQLFVRPQCDQITYNFKMDYWLKPVQIIGQDAPDADPPYTSLGTSDIGATEFQVPLDWLEIIEHGACMRGYASLGVAEKASGLQQLLYGYTMPTSGKFVPGLLATQWDRRQAQAPYMDYNIQPKQNKRGYTNTGN